MQRCKELIFTSFILVAILSLSTGLPTVMQLEKFVPLGTNLTHLKLRNKLRQQQRIVGINFTLEGDFYKYGLYFTRAKIGSPSREYSMAIDTGSDLSWVSCKGCSNCPSSNKFGLQLPRYSPYNSSSASVISCIDKRCPAGPMNHCSSQDQECRYGFDYADHSGANGIFVSDVFHLDSFLNGSAPASLVFGCTKKRSEIGTSDAEVDGVLGLDARPLSLISQLSSPKFSHCLSGGEVSGGVLVLGEILDRRTVYTPLYISKGFYGLNLQSIAINGKSVQVDPSVFKRKKGRGTIVDSGTTAIVLPVGAYDPVISSLTAAVSSFTQPENVDGSQCFKVSRRMRHLFPEVSFNFKGGVSMTVQPDKYLLWQADANNVGVWCLAIQENEYDRLTVLGDVILQDKLVVYDLAHKRLGWASRDCTKPFNISLDMSASSSMEEVLSKSITTACLTLFLYLFMIA